LTNISSFCCWDWSSQCCEAELCSTLFPELKFAQLAVVPAPDSVVPIVWFSWPLLALALLALLALLVIQHCVYQVLRNRSDWPKGRLARDQTAAQCQVSTGDSSDGSTNEDGLAGM
jgi:hypothetical protein